MVLPAIVYEARSVIAVRHLIVNDLVLSKRSPPILAEEVPTPSVIWYIIPFSDENDITSRPVSHVAFARH
jgi:hypothetical protein